MVYTKTRPRPQSQLDSATETKEGDKDLESQRNYDRENQRTIIRSYSIEEELARRYRKEELDKARALREQQKEEEAFRQGDGHFYSAYRHVGRRVFAIIVSGAGFLADSYDLFVINIALTTMKQNKHYGLLTPQMQANISIMAVCGAIVGQIVFGILGDQFGRKATFITTAGLTIAGTLMQSCASPTPLLGLNIWQQMMFFRFVLGMGVGGEYPMASTIVAECSTPEQRGRNLAGLFSMQGVGRVMCALVLVFTAYVISDHNWQWRVTILLGAVPMMVVFYFRWLPETELYTRDVILRYPGFRERFANTWRQAWEHRRKLLGTAGAWFIVDVVFYGNSLFSADVTKAMGTDHTLKALVVQNLFIQFMAMPGYLLAIVFLDRIGRKRLQIFGFTGIALTFLCMAIFLDQLRGSPVTFVILYALTFFFDDFGPNTTTFIIPAEIYPTAARATCHGISAAFGKAGAAIGGAAFLKVTNLFCSGQICASDSSREEQDKGMRMVFTLCAIVAIVGAVWTYVFVDDHAHESLQREDRRRSTQAYLRPEVCEST